MEVCVSFAPRGTSRVRVIWPFAVAVGGAAAESEVPEKEAL